VKGLFTTLALITMFTLSGCNLTDEEKEKLDNAATDLEKLADQIIITSPAKDSVVSESIITVRADIPADANAKEVALYVDGIEIAKDTDGAPWEIQWPAYYYADGNKHTLLLKTTTGSGNEVRNNEQFQLIVAESANQALGFANVVGGTQIQDQNKLEVSFAEFPTASRYEVTDGVQTVGTTSTAVTLTDLDVGTYSLRYRAIFDYTGSTTLTGPWSNPAQIEVLPPQLPVINDPVVVKNELGYEVTFSWEPIADGDTYSISLTKSGDGESQVFPTDENVELVLPDMKMGMYTWSLVRTNSLGQIAQSAIKELNVGVFKTQLGGSSNDRASQIIASQSGGYLVRANTASYEVTSTLKGSSDDWIIRLDDQGNVIDEYIENKGGRDRFRDMFEASDGSIYLVGQDWDTSKALIVKLDANLDPTWESEVLYRPTGVTERYDFISVTEWNNKLYVSAIEWGSDGNTSYWDKAHVHEVDVGTSAVSEAIAVPQISGLKIESIRSMIPKSDGNLALIGSAMLDPEPEYAYLGSGAFVITVDGGFNLVSTWANVGENHHKSVGSAIELNTGRIAVIGQSESGFALTSLNSNATHHRSYRSDVSDDYYYGSTNLAEFSNNTLLSFIGQYVNGAYRYVVKGFNENLTPKSTTSLDISGAISANGLIGNEDYSVTILYAQGQNGYNNYDVIIQRIPPISE
jgi:hypothetical protein